jgi:hypothetical protein
MDGLPSERVVVAETFKIIGASLQTGTGLARIVEVKRKLFGVGGCGKCRGKRWRRNM